MLDICLILLFQALNMPSQYSKFQNFGPYLIFFNQLELHMCNYISEWFQIGGYVHMMKEDYNPEMVFVL